MSRGIAIEHRYDAFISYNHAADGDLAPAIERGLERLAKPWYRLRAISVFRDRRSGIPSATPTARAVDHHDTARVSHVSATP